MTPTEYFCRRSIILAAIRYFEQPTAAWWTYIEAILELDRQYASQPGHHY